MLGDSKGIKWGKEGMVQLAGTKKIKSNKQITSPSSHCHQGNTGHPSCKNIPLRLHDALLCHFLFDNRCTPKTCLQPGSWLRQALTFTIARFCTYTQTAASLRLV